MLRNIESPKKKAGKSLSLWNYNKMQPTLLPLNLTYTLETKFSYFVILFFLREKNYKTKRKELKYFRCQNKTYRGYFEFGLKEKQWIVNNQKLQQTVIISITITNYNYE